MSQTPPAGPRSSSAGSKARVSALDSSATVVDSEPGDGTLGPGLERGAVVSRYIVLEKLGAGGMGMVYAAYDPDLDRKVAIKILKYGGRSHDARSRLLREAQALAKLAHPNVVAIHDVGAVGERVFVAMDFVEGLTLRAWLERKKPGWRDILATFVQAGRGLAAAHEAGLVHRDFKPDNVLVGSDGRVQVVDFGLARVRGTTTSHPVVEGSASTGDSMTRSDVLSTPITVAGAVVGTPAYMAPEQHLGEDTDAWTDQFAFCIALWEALYRTTPFVGDGPAARAFNVTQGNLVDPPKGTDVPERVNAILRRGLRVDPQGRYPSMVALLTELSHEPARARTYWIAAAATIVLGLAGAWATMAAIAERDSVCADASERLAGVWDDRVAERLTAAFGKATVSWAVPTAERTRRALDEYAEHWKSMYTETCQATHVRHDQSELLFDLRMTCLSRRRSELGALTAVLAEADGDVVENALYAVNELRPITDCADTALLYAGPQQPQDNETRRRTEGLAVQMDRTNALARAGKYEAALADARRIEQAARKIGHPPTTARALLQLGSALEASGKSREAEPILTEAARSAELGGDDRLLAGCRILLAMVVGDRLGRAREGRLWADLAETTVTRMGGGARLEAELANNRALILDGEGRYEEEVRELERALALLVESTDAEPLQLAGLHNNIASVLARRSRHDEALRHAEQAQRLWTDQLGPDHPKVAIAYATMALVHEARGNYRESLRLHEDAVALLEAGLGAYHPRVAEVVNNLAIVAITLGDLERGEQAFRRVLAVREHSLGGDHTEVASALGNLGSVLRLMDRAEESLELQKRALRIREATLPPDHPEIALSLASLANAHEDVRAYHEALPLRRRALEILEKVHGKDDPECVVDLGNLVYTLVRVERFEEAIELGRRAAAIADRHDLKVDVEAFARIALARALATSRKHRREAYEVLMRTVTALGDLPAETERRLMAELAREYGWTDLLDGGE